MFHSIQPRKILRLAWCMTVQRRQDKPWHRDFPSRCNSVFLSSRVVLFLFHFRTLETQDPESKRIPKAYSCSHTRPKRVFWEKEIGRVRGAKGQKKSQRMKINLMRFQEASGIFINSSVFFFQSSPFLFFGWKQKRTTSNKIREMIEKM